MITLWHNILRCGFHLLYNDLAWSYDLVSWLVSLGAWRDWQKAALPFVVGPTVLEIAHGPGHMLLALQQAGHTVVGLDLSRHMGQQASRRLRQAGYSPTLVRGAAQTLPFAPASFDTVLTTFPTEFLMEPETVTAVAAVLKSNGRFVIVPSGSLTGSNIVHRFIEWLYAITGQREGDFATDEQQQWPANEHWTPFLDHFSAVGFQVARQHITLNNSVVTVIVASLPEAS